jgi:1-acyl-sn-glycerol-3-phosphate acyltransferase
MDIPVKGWTFTHLWVRPLTRVWFNIYHKSITYSGIENINWKEPIIFAPSHRNAFSDALCIITPTKYTEKRFIYPLIRADAFGNSKAIDWILTRFHMIPVYRPRDRVNMVAENAAVFDHCYELLAQNRNLLIHPEGNCIPENRVRSFKKGLARIALGAEEKYDFNLDVNIIPVGITYREITEARSGIHVRYGKPVRAADFKESYQQNTASAINKLTAALHEKVKALAVDLPVENYQLAEDLLKVKKSTDAGLSSQKRYGNRELWVNQKIAGSMKNLDRRKDNRLKRLSSNINELKNLLGEHKLSLNSPLVNPSSAMRLLLKGIALLFLLPFAVYGGINNSIPWIIMHRLADKVREKQFISSARMTLGLLFFPLCYILQTLIVFFLTPWWVWAIIYLAGLPLTGLLALNWGENVYDWQQQIRLYLLPKQSQQKMHELARQAFSALY